MYLVILQTLMSVLLETTTVTQRTESVQTLSVASTVPVEVASLVMELTAHVRIIY